MTKVQFFIEHQFGSDWKETTSAPKSSSIEEARGIRATYQKMYKDHPEYLFRIVKQTTEVVETEVVE